MNSSIVHKHDVTDSKKEKKCKMYQCDFCAKSFNVRASLAQHIKTHMRKSHQCKICKKTFLHKCRLKDHVKTHSDLKEYKCSVCKKQFRSKDALRHHKNNNHSGIIYECVVCAKVCTTKYGYQEHIAIHSEKKEYICDICGKQFGTKKGIRSHIMYHLDTLYPCKHCTQTFRRKSHYIAHTRYHAQKKYHCTECKKSYVYVHDYKRHSCMRDVSYCVTCDKKFLLPEYLLKHNVTIHSEVPFCTICGKQCTSEESLLKHKATHTAKKYNCAHCSKQYRTKEGIIRHLEFHFGSRLLCTYCGKRFMRKYLYDEHILFHMNKRELSCEQCDKRFFSKANFQKHKELVHMERPHACVKCDKRFAKKISLVRHLQTHLEKVTINDYTMEEPDWMEFMKTYMGYSCEQCGRQFCSKTRLELHLLSHRKREWYKCDICEKHCLKKRKLKKHIQLHVERTCTQCGIEFIMKRELKQHIQTHVNLFNCSECHEKFPLEHLLREHLRQHSNEYLCETCGFTFSSETNLSRHRQKCHQEKAIKHISEELSKQKEDTMSEKLSEKKKYSDELLTEDDETTKNAVVEPKAREIVTNECSNVEKMFKCSVCDRTFRYEHTLKQHVVVHDPLKHRNIKEMYPCIDCYEQFTSKTALRKHATLSHKKPRKSKVLRCTKCKKEFDSKSHYILHKKHNHMQEQLMYKCTECNKQFKMERNFKLHICLQPSDKSFECAECGKQMKTKTELKNHIFKNDHPGVEQTCEHCDRKFSNKTVFENHMLSHYDNGKLYKCADCGKRFLWKHVLAKHVVIHMKKNYRCKICREEFITQAELFKHMEMYKSKPHKPYKCEKCKRRFARKWFLDRHIRSNCRMMTYYERESECENKRKRMHKQKNEDAITIRSPHENRNVLRSSGNGKRSVKKPKCFCCKGDKHEEESDQFTRKNYNYKKKQNWTPVLRNRVTDASNHVVICDTLNPRVILERIKTEPELQIKEEYADSNFGNVNSKQNFFPVHNENISNLQNEVKSENDAISILIYPAPNESPVENNFPDTDMCYSQTKSNSFSEAIILDEDSSFMNNVIDSESVNVDVTDTIITHSKKSNNGFSLKQHEVNFENIDIHSSNFTESNNSLSDTLPILVQNFTSKDPNKLQYVIQNEVSQLNEENLHINMSELMDVLSTRKKNSILQTPAPVVVDLENLIQFKIPNSQIKDTTYQNSTSMDATVNVLETVKVNSETSTNNIVSNFLTSSTRTIINEQTSDTNESNDIFHTVDDVVNKKCAKTCKCYRRKVIAALSSMQLPIIEVPQKSTHDVLNNQYNVHIPQNSNDTHNVQYNMQIIQTVTNDVQDVRCNTQTSENQSNDNQNVQQSLQTPQNVTNDIQNVQCNGEVQCDVLQQERTCSKKNSSTRLIAEKTRNMQNVTEIIVGENFIDSVLDLPLSTPWNIKGSTNVIIDIPKSAVENCKYYDKNESKYKKLLRIEETAIRKRFVEFVNLVKQTYSSDYEFKYKMRNDFCKLDTSKQALYYKREKNIWKFTCNILPPNAVNSNANRNFLNGEKPVWIIQPDDGYTDHVGYEESYPPFILRILKAFEQFFREGPEEKDLFRSEKILFEFLKDKWIRKRKKLVDKTIKIVMEANVKDEVLIYICLHNDTAIAKQMFIKFFQKIPVNAWNVKLIYLRSISGKKHYVRTSLLYGSEMWEEMVGRIEIKLMTKAKFLSNLSGIEMLVETIKNYLKVSSDTTLLEIGCKNGLLGLALAGDYTEVIGVDREIDILVATGICNYNNVENAKYIKDDDKCLKVMFDTLRNRPKIHAIINNKAPCSTRLNVMNDLRKLPSLDNIILITPFSEDCFPSILQIMQPTDDSESSFIPVRACIVDVAPGENRFETVILMVRTASSQKNFEIKIESVEESTIGK